MFPLARYNPGGPTYYGDDVRLPSVIYLKRSIIGVIAAGITFLVVLLIILPIIKHRVNTVITAVNSLCVGVAIALCILSPEWLRGSVAVQSPMSYHSPLVYNLHMGIHIGLSCVNITLKSIDEDSPIAHELHTESGGIPRDSELYSAAEFYYNEEVKMYDPEDFEVSMGQSLERGLPIPLLSLMNFLTSANLGFEGPQRIMEAGYHTFLILVFALLLWFFAQIFIVAIPRYASYAYVGIGLLMILASVVYFNWAMIDKHFPCIMVSGKFVKLNYGLCYWICLGFGVWSCIYGFTTAVLDTIYPDKFLTVFDLDYDNKRTLARAHLYAQLPKPGLEEYYEDDGTELKYQESNEKRACVKFKLPTPPQSLIEKNRGEKYDEHDNPNLQHDYENNEMKETQPQPGCSNSNNSKPKSPISNFQRIFGDTHSDTQL